MTIVAQQGTTKWIKQWGNVLTNHSCLILPLHIPALTVDTFCEGGIALPVFYHLKFKAFVHLTYVWWRHHKVACKNPPQHRQSLQQQSKWEQGDPKFQNTSMQKSRKTNGTCGCNDLLFCKWQMPKAMFHHLQVFALQLCHESFLLMADSIQQ
jgi:hypothetical protein